MRHTIIFSGFIIALGFVACGGDDDSGSSSNAGTSGKGGTSSGGKSASKGGSTSSGGKTTSSGGDGSTSGGMTGSSGGNAATTGGANTQAGSDGVGGASGGSGNAAGGTGNAGTPGTGGAPSCQTLTIHNTLNWCSVSVDGGGATTMATITRCLTNAEIAELVATPVGGFKLADDMWHHTDDDAGSGEAGDVVGSDSTAHKTMAGDECVWVCCPHTNGTGCDIVDPCL